MSTPENKTSIYKDSRFASLFQDPRFRSIHKTTQKLKIDNRFKSMFSDEKFDIKSTIDKYGRKIDGIGSKSDDLKKYYALSSSSDSDVDNDKEEIIESYQKKQQNRTKRSADGDEDNFDKIPEGSDDEIDENVKQKLTDMSTDYARGNGALMTDSSSDEGTTSGDDDNELFIKHVWGELDAEAPRTDESTPRLAACNMDWDRIRASDIMVLCSSFLPPGGSIVSVKIYPSEYGKQRMVEEEIKGPQELTSGSNNKNDSDSDEDYDSESNDSQLSNRLVENNEEGNEYNMEKLRQYQLNRLKYYYAIIECDRVSTADKLYEECDGLEYESTATKLDLRFISNDMTFDDEPKDVCTELPDMLKYQPRLFTTTALQQAKVQLTWDENDFERRELNEKIMAGKLNDVADQDLRKYVAYSSNEEEYSDDPDDNKKQNEKTLFSSVTEKPAKSSIAKYKTLLNDIKEKENSEKNKKIEMEFTWCIGGLDNKTSSGKSLKAATKMNEDSSEKKELNHFETILAKKQAQKLARKEEKKKLRKKYRNGEENNVNDSDDVDSDFNDLPDGIDMNDSYFAEEFANGDFPEHQKFKSIVKNSKQDEQDEQSKKHQAELSLLLDDDDDNNTISMKKNHFNLKQIQVNEQESKSKQRKRRAQLKKNKKSEADPATSHDVDFQIDLNDERFASVYTSHLFNIDPTDAHYRKTKGMERLIEEKLKRRPAANDDLNDFLKEPGCSGVVKKSKSDIGVQMLVKSIKRKIGRET